MGNVQLAIIAVSMIAMLLFERERYAAGGVLLAYAVVSKLYPGLLVGYLMLRRDWRAVGWTAAFAVAFVVVSVADFGVGPYVAFATHMPKLLSGEAFPAFRNPAAIAINESIPGLVFKLKLFGVPYMGFAASRALGWIYTVVALALTARLALQPVAAAREPLAWLDHLDPRDDAEPVSADLCAVPIDVVGNAAGRARVGPIAGVHDVGRCLERTRLHIRDGRCAAARERDLDVRAHGRCLRPRGNRRPDAACDTAESCHRSVACCGRGPVWREGVDDRPLGYPSLIRVPQRLEAHPLSGCRRESDSTPVTSQEVTAPINEWLAASTQSPADVHLEGETVSSGPPSTGGYSCRVVLNVGARAASIQLGPQSLYRDLSPVTAQELTGRLQERRARPCRFSARRHEHRSRESGRGNQGRRNERRHLVPGALAYPLRPRLR